MSANQENRLANFVKFSRQKAKMTQGALAQKAGVGLRFIRDLEQGKETLQFDKVNQVLQFFGYVLTPGPLRKKDGYDILKNHFNRTVTIHLKNKNVLVGIITEPVYTHNEITAWKFVPHLNAREYFDTKEPELVEFVSHAEIDDVENSLS